MTELTPAIAQSCFSISWLREKLHPNMLPCCRITIIKILETGLLFREDSLELEDNLQIEDAIGKKKQTNVLNIDISPGERVLSAIAVGICVAALPINRSVSLKRNLWRIFYWCGTAAVIPTLNRWMVPNTLSTFLKSVSEYTVLLRKCMSYLKHQLYSKPQRNLAVNALRLLLIQQQREVCYILQNLNCTLESLFPWLTSSSWEFSSDDVSKNSEDLMKIHHLFLLHQSTFLKNVALSHLSPSIYAKDLHIHYNEKIYWIHSVVFPSLSTSVNDYCKNLNSAYVFFKEYSIKKDACNKGLPKITREPWKYSEVHTNIVLCSSELRTALDKCNEMDNFLEAYWNAKSQFSPQIFEDDLTKLKEYLRKCFNTIETISVQVKKISVAEMKLLEQAVQKLHLPVVEEEDTEAMNVITLSEDTKIEIPDEVFYFEKLIDENLKDLGAEDYSTKPGNEQINATKLVLDELKTKLVKREDEMRERENIALEKTMPEYKGKLPIFPRQIINISHEIKPSENKHVGSEAKTVEINGIEQHSSCSKNNKDYIVSNGIQERNETPLDCQLNSNSEQSYESDTDVVSQNNTEYNETDTSVLEHRSDDNYEAISNQNRDQSKANANGLKNDIDETISDEASIRDVTKNKKLTRNKYALKRDCQFKCYHNSGENHSANSGSDHSQNEHTDEDSEPLGYSFGTGMAMASLLHIKNNNSAPVNNEQVFVGDGEVSSDSGNEA